MPTSGLKVALQVSKEHRHEMQDALNCTVHRLSSHLFFLAKRYVEAKNYLAAAPWAELHLLHVKQYKTDNRRLSMAHKFAAMAQRCADFLSKSLE